MFATRLFLGKLGFIILLWVIFLLYFGIPSIKNYLKRETILVESERRFTMDDLPTISVNKMRSMKSFDYNSCPDDGSSLEECLESVTGDINQTVDYIKIGSKGKGESQTEYIWESSYVTMTFGRIFLMRSYNQSACDRLRINFTTDAESSTKVEVEFQDKNNKLEKSSNMKTYPRVIIPMEEGQSLYVFLGIAEYNLLPEISKCNSDPQYSFAQCTRVT